MIKHTGCNVELCIDLSIINLLRFRQLVCRNEVQAGAMEDDVNHQITKSSNQQIYSKGIPKIEMKHLGAWTYFYAVHLLLIPIESKDEHIGKSLTVTVD